MAPALKNRQLFKLGVDVVIMQPFDMAFASIEAEALLPHILQLLPGLATIYVGGNWRFGRGRRGDIHLLVAEAKKLGINVVSAERINQNGEPISSTRIRGYLEEGRIEEANALLGYSYFAEGVVIPGKKLGRTIGFPTLNVSWEPDLRPRLGVYAVRVSGSKSPLPLPGVANYGVRPTVESAATVPVLETHLLGACPFTAGDGIKVEWLRFLRPEQKFANLDELRGQIARDCQAAAVPS